MTTSTDRLNGLVGSVAIKVPVKVATTGNITLSGLQTIDGVALIDNDRVLVKNQTNQIQNGVWVASSGIWQRATDFNGSYDVVKGTIITVAQGTINTNVMFTVATINPIIGISNIAFTLLLPYSGVSLQSVQSVTSLRNTEPTLDGQVISLLGHTTAGVGGGLFRHDAGDTTTADDNGLTIVTTGGKRWKRILDGFIDSDMFGGDAKKVVEGANTKHAITLLSDATITSTINLRSDTTIEGNGFSLFLGSNNMNPLSARGTINNTFTDLTSNMLYGSNTFVTVLSLAVGDWVFIRSEALYTDPAAGTIDDPAPVSKYGQIFKITHKSGNTYRTDIQSEHDFNLSDTAQVAKINPLENIIAKNIKINEENYTNQFTIGLNNLYIVNSVFENLILYGSKAKYGSDIPGRSALKFTHCVNVLVKNLKAYHIGWYDVEFLGANRNVVVDGIYGHDCRHTASFNWLEGYGKAIDCHVRYGTADENTLAGFDTHANANFDCCSFQGLLSKGSKNDSGFQLRSDIRVIDCEGSDNAIDGIVGRGIGVAPTVINFIAKRNLRSGVRFTDYGVNLINATILDNAVNGINVSSGIISGGRAERNNEAIRIDENVLDTKNLKIDGLTAPFESGKQTIGIFFRGTYDRARCLLDNNDLIGYGDFVYTVSDGTGNASYPTSNKNNKTRNHAVGSETRGRHTFAGAGSQVITTTAFRSLVTPTGTRGGGQISNVILTPLSGASTLTYRWTRTSPSSFTIIVNEACEIEWVITGI